MRPYPVGRRLHGGVLARASVIMRAAWERVAACSCPGLAVCTEVCVPDLCQQWGFRSATRLWPPQILTNL